jgi:hypothetical protein
VKNSILILLSIVLLSCAQAAAQRRSDEPLPPKTELEALQLETGAVIIRGSQRVGGVRAQGLGRVDVAAYEVIDIGSGRRARGVAVEVEEGGERGREVTAFVDYEELDGLIKGLESVGKVDRGETQLPSFEVSFRTKGDLIVSVFSSRGGLTRCVVSAGEFSPARVPIPFDELANLRTLISTAKNRLDDARAK